MTDAQQLCLRIQEAVTAALARLRARGCALPPPEVRCDLRGQQAGQAWPGPWRLRFNLALCAANLDDFLTRTVAHEVAHLAAWHLHGRAIRPHGAEWRAIMRDVFGLEGRTHHAYDVRSVAGRQYSYRCACAEHELSVRRHRRFRQGFRYLCRRCRTELQPH